MKEEVGIRGKEFVEPRGQTEISAGDQVILVGPAAEVKKAKDMILESA